MKTDSFGTMTSAPDSLPAYELMARACAAVSRTFSRQAESQDEWMRAVADDLHDLLFERVGVMAMIAQWHPGESRWESISLGLAGDYPESAVCALRAQAEQGWPDDDFSRRIGHAGALLEASCAPRHRLMNDDSWNGCAYARFRDSLGLYELARAAVPFMDPRGSRLMILQVDGVSPAWTPTAATLTTLGCIMHPAMDAYHARFVEQRMARAGLLNQLSPTQRRIVPMLAEGLTEAQIAEQIHRSAHTVHDHTRSIYRALGVSSRLELRDAWMGR